MSLRFERVDEDQNSRHQYVIDQPVDDEEPWLRTLAKLYIELKTETALPLNGISVEGLDVVSAASVSQHLAEAAAPGPPRKVFDVVRSDLGELLAYTHLEEVFATRIGYKALRDRELSDLPGRGLDIVGIEDEDPPVLVLGEVKVSDEARCPPRVVDIDSTSMRAQHLGHLSDLRGTGKKILWMSRSIRDVETRDMLMAAAVMLREGRSHELDISSCSVLVRSQELACLEDCGSFRDTPSDYEPAVVRFVTVTLPSPVSEILADFRAEVEQAVEAA